MKKAIIILAMAVCLAACDQVEPYGMEMDTAYVEVVVDNYDEGYDECTKDMQETIDALKQERAALYAQINRSDAATAECEMRNDGMNITLDKEEAYGQCLRDMVREYETFDLEVAGSVEGCEMELQ